jgi:cytoskeletal protein RodZ
MTDKTDKDTPVSTEGKTVGEILRGAREARKLSVEQVNRETKISVQTVRALEQDDFGAFPSETYLKGFVRTYAEFLGLDGNRLWAMIGTRTTAQATGPGPSWETESGMREERLGPPRWIRSVLVPVLVVAVIVLVILLVRERRKVSPPAVGSRATTGATLASR